MNIRLFLAGTPVLAAVTEAAENPQPGRDWKSNHKADQWIEAAYGSFAMAYFLKPLEDYDDRPDDPDFPFTDGERKKPSQRKYVRVLRDEASGALDIANLVASASHRAKVPRGKMVELVKALLESDVEAPAHNCYVPHHVIVSYDRMGAVTGVIEMCVSCIGFRIYPGGSALRTPRYDFVRVARILVNLGLPLDNKNTSNEDYIRQVDLRLKKRIVSGAAQ